MYPQLWLLLTLFGHHIFFIIVFNFSMFFWSKETLKIIPFYKWKSYIKRAHSPTVHSLAVCCTSMYLLKSPRPRSLPLLWTFMSYAWLFLFLSAQPLCFTVPVISRFLPSVSQWSEDQSTLLCTGFLFRLQLLWSKTQSLSSQPTVYTLTASCWLHKQWE